MLIISGFPGENINICWSPDGQTIAVGNKDDVVTFIDAKTHRSKAEEQFKFEVNEISWNNDNNMFFLTNGNGCINILRWGGSSLGTLIPFFGCCGGYRDELDASLSWRSLKKNGNKES